LEKKALDLEKLGIGSAKIWKAERAEDSTI